MISGHVDLGQIIIAALMAVVGWFIKREITVVANRLNQHELIIQDLIGKIQNVIGYNQAVKELGLNRRQGGTLE